MVRAKDIFEVVSVTIALGALVWSVRVVGESADQLWGDYIGLLFSFVAIAATPFGGNFDIPVAFTVGFFTGLFLLFFVDGTKRVQALLVILFGGFSFFTLLEQNNRILGSIALQPIPFALGCVVGTALGLTTTLYASSMFPVEFRSRNTGPLERLRWIQFPTAAKGFLWGTSALVLLTAVDYAFISSVSSGLADRMMTLIAAGTFIVAMTVFTQYKYQRDIVAVSPSDHHNRKYHPYVVGGLYEHAREHYHALPSTGIVDQALAEARADQMENLPSMFAAAIEFGILWPTTQGASARKVIITSEGWTTEALGGITAKHGETDLNVSPVYRVLRWMRHYLGLAVPRIFREWVSSSQTDIISRLDHADTALLIVSTPSEAGDVDHSVEETFRILCNRYADPLSTDVVIATTEAVPVAEQEGLDVNSEMFKNHCKHRLGVDNCTLVALDRFNDDTQRGFDDLLKELSD